MPPVPEFRLRSTSRPLVTVSVDNEVVLFIKLFRRKWWVCDVWGKKLVGPCDRIEAAKSMAAEIMVGMPPDAPGSSIGRERP